MPYSITKDNPDCSGWAVVDPDNVVFGCHQTKAGAIAQAVAISLSTGEEFVGERLDDGPPALIVDIDGTLIIDGRPNDDVIRYIDSFDDTLIFVVTSRFIGDRAETLDALLGFDIDFDEVFMRPEGIEGTEFKASVAEKLLESYNVMVAVDNDEAARAAYRDLGITALAVEDVPNTDFGMEDEEDDEMRAVDLSAPEFMRAAARRGLDWHEQGLSGDGIVARTIREARAMAAGQVTEDKWRRLSAWIARHLVDLEAPDADPDSEGYPSAGVVAHALWGSVGGRTGALRAKDYADRIIARLEAESEDTARSQVKTTYRLGRMNDMGQVETREFVGTLELRQEGDGNTFTGYAALFNSPSEPLPFTEIIAPGAFKRSLASRNDVKMLFNHDAGQVLASTRSGTLSLMEDERGLRVTASLPDTTTGRDVRELVSKGIIDAMSFGFTVPHRGDSWSDDGSTRTLKSVRLHEVSIVAWPAYSSTAGTVAVRGLDRLAQRAEVDADALQDVLTRLENGAESLSPADRALLEQVLDRLVPVDEPVGDLDLLALKKKKLDLLERL